MRRYVTFLLLLGLGPIALTLSPNVHAAPESTLDVRVSRDRIYIGESLLIEVKVGGSDNPTPPDLSAIRNGTPQFLGSQSSSRYSVIIINGQMRREGFTGRTFTYKLTPQTEGQLVIGPVTATVEGQTLTATGPVVTVTGITRQDTVAVAVTASRDTVLVDEPFDIRLAVKIRRLPGRFADVDPLFPADPPHLETEFLNGQEIDGLKGPDFKRLLNSLITPRQQSGFTLNNYTVQADLFDFSAMMNPQGVPARFMFQRQLITEQGKDYWEYALTIPYSPLAEGSHTFGPVLFKGNVPVSVNENGEATGAPIFAVGAAAIVRVIPPPETNRPASYIGAVGSNLVVEAVLDAQTCNVGDPLKLTLSVSGPVQLRNLTPPKLSLQEPLQDLFEVYDDTVQTVRQDNRCLYSYTLRPRRAGSVELPPIEASFYDITLREYRRVTTQPIPLKVRPSSEITAAQVIGGTTNQSLSLHREDESLMRPAGMRCPASAAEAASLTGAPGQVLAIALAGPAVFLAALAGILVRRLAPAIRLSRKRRKAFSRARKELKHCAAESLCGLLRQYLSDRFTCTALALTPSEARSLLMAKGVPETMASRFENLMQRYFNAAFETAARATPVDVKEVEALLAEIERQLATVPGGMRPGTAVILLALVLGGLDAVSMPAEQTFIWSEAVAQMSSAQTPRDFLEAAGTLQKLVDLGVRNADLFYNQGTALLLAEKPADAIQVLLRAERYGGCAPDIRRNLAIAEARREGLKEPVDSWLRSVLFLHYRLDSATRTCLAAASFSLIWLAAALGVLGARRAGKATLIIGTLLLVAFGSSVLTTLQQEGQVQRPASIPVQN